MASFLEKEYGPFTGGVWVVIVVGGVGLAFFIRKSMGSGSGSDAKTEPLLAIETQTAPRVFGDVGQYGGGSSIENPPNQAPPQVPPTTPKTPDKPPVIIGYDPKPRPAPKPTPAPAPAVPPVVVAPAPGKGRTVPPPSPAPSPTPAPGNVPGGFPLDCQGVGGRPSDAPANAAAMLADIHNSKNPSQRRGKYLGWLIAGVGSAPIPTKLQAASAFVNNQINWPLINQTRRSRGLRAMNSEQFKAMASQFAAYAKKNAGRDDFGDEWLGPMWAQWYDGFVCNNAPRPLGIKTTAAIR